ncbi:MAG: DUF4375 domain-containing protein [Desulfobacterales bacterium]|nr:DUF4375 domain-containing protein [Desulfobacterales bacterium]
MEKVEIEQFVSRKIREVVEKILPEIMQELNHAGCRFIPTNETLTEWIEPNSDESLSITCAIGVGFIPILKKRHGIDPIVQSYIMLAESGVDKDATLLNLLEGDIANGGFMQLYENKGEQFIQDAITMLRKIGSRTALHIVEQAFDLIQQEKITFKNYETLRKKLHRLDSRFWRLKESIPVLYEQYRQKNKKINGK